MNRETTGSSVGVQATSVLEAVFISGTGIIWPSITIHSGHTTIKPPKKRGRLKPYARKVDLEASVIDAELQANRAQE